MHAALHILLFWALAFVSLCVTLVLLDIFWDLIEQDLCLQTLGKEVVIAAIASLIEAIGLWLIIGYAHDAPSNIVVCLLIVPGFIVGLIYKFSHLEDWGHYEIIGLLFFQLVISLAGAALLTGHFALAIPVVIIFAVALAVVVAFVKGL
ncbi:MAG: hypothetical protein ACREC8_05715 [Limisphaerales bacterium]